MLDKSRIRCLFVMFNHRSIRQHRSNSLYINYALCGFDLFFSSFLFQLIGCSKMVVH